MKGIKKNKIHNSENFLNWLHSQYPGKKSFTEDETNQITQTWYKQHPLNVTYFIPKSEEFLDIRDLAKEISQKKKEDWSTEDTQKFISLITSRKIGFEKDDLSVNEPLKKALGARFDITTSADVRERTAALQKMCVICGKPIWDYTGSGLKRIELKKCCSPKCNSLYRKRKRGGKLVYDQDAVCHDTCVICHKPLTKRLGAKTCSPLCRKKLSLKNKIISVPAML